MLAFHKQIFISRIIVRKCSSSGKTVDMKEMERMSALTEEWWNQNGKIRPLHRLNLLRVPLVEKQLFKHGKISQEQFKSSTPLAGISLIDVGCGGGILTEPLAQRGASTIGLDPNEELLQVARNHCTDLPNLTYIQDTIENYSKENSNKFDVVIASETIEHVAEQEIFLKNSVDCLKPGGSIFITTNNRTLLSKLIGIYFYENVARCIPQGIHDYDKFIHIRVLEEMLKDLNCEIVFNTGMIYNPFTATWKAIRSNQVWYALQAVKNVN